METFGVIIVAAGKGSRMGTKESKQYLKLGKTYSGTYTGTVPADDGNTFNRPGSRSAGG